jgi:RNA polymerase sigma factor (sigma-70 family)
MRNLAVELRIEPYDQIEIRRCSQAEPGLQAVPRASRLAITVPSIVPANSTETIPVRTALTSYFTEVGRSPLLTPEGEVACGLRMTAGKLALFEAFSAWPGLYRVFRGWRAELEEGASPYRLRAIGDGADASETGDGDEDSDDRSALEQLFEQHRVEAIAAIDQILDYEPMSVGRDVAGRSNAGRAIADYGLLAPQFKLLVDTMFADGKALASIDMEAARVTRATGCDAKAFSELWLSYSPLWGGTDRANRSESPAPFEGRIEFAGVLSRLADFSRSTGLAVPAFRRVLALAKSSIAIVEEAKNEMVCANMRLVVSFAKQFRFRGVAFEDLIQEGNIGLLRAVDGYDHSLGYRFANYASWWIKVSMKRAIADQSRTIRYPVHLVDKISKVRVATLLFRQRNGRRPTEAEIIQATGLKPWIVARCLEAATTVSIDEIVGQDGKTSRGDLIEDTEGMRPDEPLLQGDRRRRLGEVLATLPEREAHIIRHRFGLDAEERTFEQLGTEMSLCRERIRQLETKALRTLQVRAGNRGLRVLL